MGSGLAEIFAPVDAPSRAGTERRFDVLYRDCDERCVETTLPDTTNTSNREKSRFTRKRPRRSLPASDFNQMRRDSTRLGAEQKRTWTRDTQRKWHTTFHHRNEMATVEPIRSRLFHEAYWRRQSRGGRSRVYRGIPGMRQSTIWRE
jgi:hypothetical protein